MVTAAQEAISKPAGKLQTVELARGIAALAVVAFHTNTTAAFVGLESSAWLSPFQFGVDFFFVLSGFIIFHVHRGDMGQPDKARPYLIKRFVRLYPLLWIVAGGWIVLRTLTGQGPGASGIGSSLLLYPSLVETVPKVVWTLRHEVLFYLAFGLAILNRKAGLALFGLWTGGVLYQMVRIAGGNPIEGVGSLLLSSFQIDFVLGALVAVLADKLRARSWLPLVLGLVLVAAFAWASVTQDIGRTSILDYTSHGTLFLPLNGAAFAMVLYGLLCIEDRVTVPRWGVLLGGASYAIYLVHTVTNAILQHAAFQLGNGLGHLFLFASGIAVGIGIHLLVERRLTSTLRGWLLPQRSTHTNGAPDSGLAIAKSLD